ncbi:MAG TPA: VOC family protein [Chloroflexota bacterium]|jgi:predicted enzyme related to lactoylglutathione lyase
MPALRHIAVVAEDPARMAEYYKSVFEMYEVRRSASGAVYLSDAVMSLVLLPHRPDGETAKLGPHHFGFQVEDVATVQTRMAAAGADATAHGTPRDGRYAEQWSSDPEGNRVDLSVAGWATVPAEPAGAAGTAVTQPVASGGSI